MTYYTIFAGKNNPIFLFLSLLFVLAFTACGGTSEMTSDNGTPPPTSPPVTGKQIIADHTVVALYDTIPQSVIDEVKKMFLNVPGESHSEAYRMGLVLLEEQDSKFAVNVSNPPEGYTDQHLRISRATWGDLDSSFNWQSSYGEEDFFTSEAAQTATKRHVDHCAANGLEIDALGFGWCWDMTSPGVAGDIDPDLHVRWGGSSIGGPDGSRAWGLDDEDFDPTGNRVNMDTYLQAVEEYNRYSRGEGYRTIVFFTTGPADTSGELGYQRHLKHEHMRSFVREDEDSHRVLFDYADILNHNDAGEKNTTTWDSHTFGIIHPDNLGGSEVGHIGEVGALRLGKALWWMLARMTGWDGISAD